MPVPDAATRYGPEHRARRADWAPRVATGNVACWRCHQLIGAREPWHLGHGDDHERDITKGPEHVACNVGASNRGARVEPTPAYDPPAQLGAEWD